METLASFFRVYEVINHEGSYKITRTDENIDCAYNLWHY